MKKQIELLAPGGDIDSIKAAIVAGANAVYCGLEKFNARNRATNISFDQLQGILHLAHLHQCKVFLTLNIIVVESEIDTLFSLLNKLVNTSIDGIIIQDLGLFYIVSQYFKRLSIHASTQATTHNKGQIAFLQKLNVDRVNFSRELAIDEIKQLTSITHSLDIESEVFVHGSNCICFSGICYMSSVISGNSGNRGRCSQPCRDQFETTKTDKQFPLNMKDNSAFTNIKELYDAGVDSLKIEGRIKKFHYVFTIIEAWKKQLELFYNQDSVSKNRSALYSVFNRDFTNGYLTGTIGKDMFIDNPRDNSAIFMAETNGGYSDESIEKAKAEIYNVRTDIITTVQQRIDQLSISKSPLSINVTGENGKPLQIQIKTLYTEFVVSTKTALTPKTKDTLNYEQLFSKLKSINDTEYFIEHFDVEKLQLGLSVPFKELTDCKRQILFTLLDSNAFVDPISVPKITNNKASISKPKLSVLISNKNDIEHCRKSSATIFFQLPSSIKNEYESLIELFTQNTDIIAWFPSILIGNDFTLAIQFLSQVKPKQIVTNNTGIAFEAYKQGIAWIAGPFLNIVNSFSLLCLKEQFNCKAAFISNELSKVQIKSIKKPDDFELYFSIYHPSMLMTSRQCLFQQITGCHKSSIDEHCISDCHKHATLTNKKGEHFEIIKTKGRYNAIYSQKPYINTAIINDIPNTFSSYCIDLTNYKTQNQLDKITVIDLFKNLIDGDEESKTKLDRLIQNATSLQYLNGI